MDFHNWLTYTIACLLIAVSPGSGAVLCMSRGLSHGFRSARATIVGLEAGLVLILLIAGAGVGSLLVASETAFWLVKIVGAGYLIYLGLTQWRSRQGLGGLDRDAPARIAPSQQQQLATGFLTNATNPKGILFMVAVLPQFISPERPLTMQLLILAVTMVAIDTLVMAGYMCGASLFSRWMTGAKAIRIQNRIFGGLLVAVGIGLLLVRQSKS